MIRYPLSIVIDKCMCFRIKISLTSRNHKGSESRFTVSFLATEDEYPET